VGELARMIKGERWLPGLDGLDLTVVEMRDWRRSMRWPELQRPWIATSPNIPSFEAALVYPGMGVVGEANVNEGRGTPAPCPLFGPPCLDARRAGRPLNGPGLPGARSERADFTPRSTPTAAAHPRFEGKPIRGVRIVATDVARFEPLETGMHVLAALAAEARSKGVAPLFPNLAMFYAISGTKRLHRMLDSGSDGAAIIAAWRDQVAGV